MATSKYSDYFEIDKDYFPCVDKNLIDSGKVDWRSFYPHESFVRLINGTLDALEGIKPRALWVEGAYGTGKSYAALTIQKILTEPNNEVEQYFKDNLSSNYDLLNRVIAVKSKKILTVNIYGSSHIDSDLDLINTLQDSINEALSKNGFETKNDSIKQAILNWFGSPINKEYFNKILSENDNAARIGGYDSVDKISSILSNVDNSITAPLIDKILNLANDPQYRINISKIATIDDFEKWLFEAIEMNGIDTLLIIWDEFTEYFKNNKNSLTGFQKIIELCTSPRFKIMIVTHSSESLLAKDDREKILDRFIRPTFKIELPEKMALDLIAKALKKKDNDELSKKWDRYSSSLIDNLTESINVVSKQAKISEKTLQGIIPITPYAALMLKHLSSTFKSNQRSMFEFIKDDSDANVEGFQWFINNTGENSSWNLLTIDMLWNYFYDNGKDGLETDVRLILDSYDINQSKMGNIELQRVCKTILLLQAMSNRMGNDVPIFKPTLDNLKLAFDGTDLLYRVQQIADSLVKKQIIIAVENENGEKEYNVGTNSSDFMKVEKQIQDDLKKITTFDIINETELVTEFFKMDSYYSRYKPIVTDKDHLKMEMKKSLEHSKSYNYIDLYIVLSSTEEESTQASSLINEIDYSNYDNLVVVDYSKVFFGIENKTSFVRYRAWESYYTKSDTKKQKSHNEEKRKIIAEWIKRIESNKCYVHTRIPGNTECRSYSELKSVLITYAQKLYPLGLEHFKIGRADYYTTAQNAKTAAECAIKRENKGRFLAQKDPLKNSLIDVWDKDNYWTDPASSNLFISKIKNNLEEEIKKQLEERKTISVEKIYYFLHDKPYGFTDSDLSAYYMGFLLSDYATPQYSISNGIKAPSDPVNGLSEAIKQTFTDRNSGKYSEWCITPISDNLSNFYDLSATVFSFNRITDVDQCVDMIRASIRNFEFPLWALPFGETLDSNLKKAIDLIVQLVGSTDASEKSRLAEELGSLGSNDDFTASLKRTITKEKCWAGMQEYLNRYRDGLFIKESKKFNCDNPLSYLSGKQTQDSPWLWNRETTDASIDDTIVEFKIIGKVYTTLNKECKTLDSVCLVIRKWIRSLVIPIKAIENSYVEYASSLDALLQFSSSKPDRISLNTLVNQLDQLDDLFKLSDNVPLLFKTIYGDYFSDYSLEEIEEITEGLSEVDNNNIPLEKFNEMIIKAISKYNEGLKKNELLSYWFEKTNTKSPKDWSNKHQTPIESIITEDVNSTKLLISVLSGYVTNPELVEKSLQYLKQSNFVDLLNDEEYVDKCFREKILGKYSPLFKDLKVVRSTLQKRQNNIEVWGNSSEIIKELARIEYDRSAKERALAIIDSIPVEKLQEYLRDQVESNMNLGIELLNDNE